MKKVPVEVYSRVVGYFRPVDCWNDGKKSEFEDRAPAKVQAIKLTLKSMAECEYMDATGTE